MQNFFTDGLMLVFSYLDDHDWIRTAACTCHRWFKIATSDTQRQIIVYRREWQQPLSSSFTKKVGKFFKGIFTSKDKQQQRQQHSQQQIRSSWSLAHYVTSLDLQMNKLTSKRLRFYSLLFPSLTSLHISPLIEVYFFLSDAKAECIPFPSSLRVIKIRIACSFRNPQWNRVQTVINSIGQVRELETLELLIRGAQDISSDALDWTPLIQLQHLHTMHLAPIICSNPLLQPDGEEPLVVFLRMLAQISTDTIRTLTLEFGLLTLQPHHIALLQYPSLRALKLMNGSSNGSTLYQISKSFPTLESIEGNVNLIEAMELAAGKDSILSAAEDDVAATQKQQAFSSPAVYHSRQLFPQLHTLIGIQHKSDQQLIDSLCYAFSPDKFTRLGIFWRPFDSSIQWNRIAASYPLLHTIRLASMQDDRLAMNMKVMSGSELLMQQLRHLELYKCWISKELDPLDPYASLLQLFHPFTSIETLLFDCSIDAASAKRLMLTLSQLKSVTIITPAGIRVSVVREGIWMEKINTKHRIVVYQPPAAAAPSPRLVGIELNPGPSTSGSTNAHPFQSLFNDGLMLVQSHLNDRDWFTSTRVCRHWFAIASHTPFAHRSLSIHITGEQLKEKASLLGRFLRIFSEKKKKDTSNLIDSSSPWSLSRHVHTLNLKYVYVHRLHEYLTLFSRLESLTINALIERAASSASSSSALSLIVPKSLSFPPSLTSLFVHLLHAGPTLLQSTLRGISHCPNLRSLTIVIPGVEAVDWTPIESLDVLESLHLTLNLANQDHIQIALFNSLTRMQAAATTLTSLEFDRLSWQSYTMEETVAWTKFPLLRSFSFNHHCQPEFLLTLSRGAPLLEEFTGTCDLMALVTLAKQERYTFPLFPSLHSFEYRRIDPNTELLDQAELRSSLCCIAPPDRLTHLTLSCCLYLRIWQALSTSYPLLRRIKLNRLPQLYFSLSLDALIESRLAHDRLTHLHLNYCLIHASRFKYLGYFKLILEFHIEDCFHTDHTPLTLSKEMISLCESEKFMPSLRRWKWMSGHFDLEWDTEKRINRIRQQIFTQVNSGKSTSSTTKNAAPVVMVETRLNRPFLA